MTDNSSHPHAERVEQAREHLWSVIVTFANHKQRWKVQRAIDEALDAYTAAVRSEGAPALEVQRQTEEENDLGAALWIQSQVPAKAPRHTRPEKRTIRAFVKSMLSVK